MVFGLVWRRLLQLVPVVFGVTLITFGILNLLPGGTASVILGSAATPQSIAQLNKQLNLDYPFWIRYWHWLYAALFHFNLGKSYLSNQAISNLIATRAPVTAELGLFALVIALVLVLPIAILSARRPGGLIDRIFTFASLASISVPLFVLGLALLLVFAQQLNWFPTSGFEPVSAGLLPNLRSLVLPAITLAALPFAIYLRVLRGDMVQQLASEHYVETARGKGLRERRILLRHVLPNALFGMVTVVTVHLGSLIGGSVLVEQVFAVPGMGSALVTAINNHDAPVVQGVVICLAIVLANLLADVLYGLLDPRVRLRHGR